MMMILVGGGGDNDIDVDARRNKFKFDAALTAAQKRQEGGKFRFKI
jgi:hypothetical protein